jgi:alpha 1,3-mannosyltransferase
MAIAQYFQDHPVATSEFGEMGQRVEILTSWMEAWGDHSPAPKGGDGKWDYPTPYTPENYTVALETLAVTLFPFIRKPHTNESEPLRLLRKTFTKGPGIVIPTNIESFRFACHLILNLRLVLHSTLPIQILYAGDEALPLIYRKAIKQIERTEVDFVDITKVLDTTTLGLRDPKSTIKPFAILASSFSQVVLLDPDAIFMQKPELIFWTHKGYWKTGVLLFHDRLVEKGEHENLHEWWRHQMRKHEPSKTFQKSITMKEGYGQEADSGAMIIDKGQLGVLMGLLHACWQNTKEVRDRETYMHLNGDKETYWLGLELSGVPYSFAEDYGAVLGKSYGDGSVHGSQIAHVDEAKKLLWFNGSLLKKKGFGGSPTEYYVPEKWMTGGTWTWTMEEEFSSYMTGEKEIDLTDAEKSIIAESVDAAKYFDQRFANLLDLPVVEEKDPPQPGNITRRSSTLRRC